MFFLLAAATAAKSLQSCPTLCNPIDGSPPCSPVSGILKAITLEWVAISFSNFQMKVFFHESEEYSKELPDIIILFSLYYIQGIYWIESSSGNVLKIKSFNFLSQTLYHLAKKTEFMGSLGYL